MKFTSLFTIISALSVVSAAPTSYPGDSTPSNHPNVLFKRKDCPTWLSSKGICNGTSCRYGFKNYKCNEGKCVGKNGGDGACCGWRKGSNSGVCPNGGW
ncbi:hypothetical protein B0J13DRAFT_42241 [Dactylonectria estremocensis]|uniref:Uncharacterized protein n=1 Tax=Dactylonectria estremocensis TaxID=1079267 RepID=A0A9P9J2X3_9HYPO|nr:hypothetical protein B0J13DRAFT_42241 [Dactylonectria estremocensis]